MENEAGEFIDSEHDKFRDNPISNMEINFAGMNNRDNDYFFNLFIHILKNSK